ncbi:hypothetical protein [Neorhizobium sp. NCHU2750]|uniref:DUF6946 family protein n=1 Tax=Neorhizobium sp. NCHU2750 TaxID=1825976 RepID=UPI000EB71DFC|nr:hypothetical protein NCHU2750_36650 [Neorhizobium sp. NCHU2750]
MAKANRIYIPSSGPSAWKQFLAEPEKQWRTGYSARTLAHSWEMSQGLPLEVARMFPNESELLIAIPEHKVALPGGGRESQNDVFALIRHGDLTCASMIEGKVNEPFGPTIGDWMKEASQGKLNRMTYLCDLLGLPVRPEATIRYQLLHRTASAIIEAKRFKTDEAAMFVHSFSPDRMWFQDFAAFVHLLGCSVMPDQPAEVRLPDGMLLRLGWASGDMSFLAA